MPLPLGSTRTLQSREQHRLNRIALFKFLFISGTDKRKRGEISRKIAWVVSPIASPARVVQARSGLVREESPIIRNMKKIQRASMLVAVVLAALSLQGCLTSVVTAPVKIVYGASKLAVKGTAAAVRAVVPDGDKDKKDDSKDDKKEQQPEQSQQTTP